MQICRENLLNINSAVVAVPRQAMFDLPEKVLQFGTGVLLRALPDYIIDSANRAGVFNGRIVVVKSTSSGDLSAFERQDCLYTVCMRGSVKGQKVEENVICSSISRVLSADKQWLAVLDCARNPDLSLVISNTTEVGIELVNEDIRLSAPLSFPGKLLAFLYERYQFFAGSPDSGLVIVPTELISDNGKKLRSIILELAAFNKLEPECIAWIEQHNEFCSSLVDRIVPGSPSPEVKTSLEATLGYRDDLVTMSEVYSLWAIEGGDRAREVMNFATVYPSVIIAPDITLYKELKLRLLNGTHTLSCGIAFLSGFKTVLQAMEDEGMSGFIRELMVDEIAPAIPFDVPGDEAKTFALNVIDRFSNPSIAHQWISITLNYTAKMKMRVVPVLQNYYAIYKQLPPRLTMGFAAWLAFMKIVKKEGQVYYGEYDGQFYPVQDEKAAYFFDLWKNLKPETLVKTVLSDASLWNADLSTIPGLTEKLSSLLDSIGQEGMKEAMMVNQESNNSNI